MKLIRGLINLQHQNESCVATIGNFDGVHVGHQAIIKRLIVKAKELNLPSCVMLFEPHPKEYFMGQGAPARLTNFREKYQLLANLGIDKLVVLQFNASLRNMEAKDFVTDVLVNRLSIKHLVVGDDFHFGKQRKGNFQLLAKMANSQYTLEPTPSVLVNGERVSSTLVRNALAESNLEKAKSLLGRMYSISGKVGYGKQLGRKINFPTANIALKRLVVPLKGVFLVRASWDNEKRNVSAWGVANIGARPTVSGLKTTLEVYVLDEDLDLYGKPLTATFVKMLRDEKKFDSLELLKQQIAADVESAKHHISALTSSNDVFE